jgi:hypothetical protein
MSDVDALSELVDHLALDSPAVDAVVSDPLAFESVDQGPKAEQQMYVCTSLLHIGRFC